MQGFLEGTYKLLLLSFRGGTSFIVVKEILPAKYRKSRLLLYKNNKHCIYQGIYNFNLYVSKPRNPFYKVSRKVFYAFSTDFYDLKLCDYVKPDVLFQGTWSLENNKFILISFDDFLQGRSWCAFCNLPSFTNLLPKKKACLENVTINQKGVLRNAKHL